MLRRNVYLFAWALLLSVFVIRTAPNFWNDLRRGKIVTPSPYASLDRILETLLRVPQPSARLSEAFAQLPERSSLLFVSPKNDERWDFVYSAVCYLTWPRKIDRAELAPNENFSGAVSEETAIVFCGIPPSIDTRSRLAIGPDFVMLRPVAPK